MGTTNALRAKEAGRLGRSRRPQQQRQQTDSEGREKELYKEDHKR